MVACMFGFSIANPKTTEYAFVLVSFWLAPLPHSSFCRLPFKAEQWSGRGNSSVPQNEWRAQALSTLVSYAYTHVH